MTQEELAEIIREVWKQHALIDMKQSLAMSLAKAILDRGFVAPMSAEWIDHNWPDSKCGCIDDSLCNHSLELLAQAINEHSKAWVERVTKTLKGYQRGHAELTSYLPETDEDVKPCTCPLCEEADRLLTGEGE